MGRVLAVTLLIPGLPIIGLMVVLVRLTSRGPGLHRQTRIGKDGRPFTMYKIRTMWQNVEQATGAVWAHRNDERVTPVGKMLRKLYLDEFPQLFNVLRGEMCLIGPRPERPEFVRVLTREIPGYTNRLAVPPGVTGLAQVNLPPDTDLQSVRHKLALDLEYIKNAGPLLDIRLFLCTCVRLLGLPGNYSMRMFGLQRDIIIELGSHMPSSNGASTADGSFVTPAHIIRQAADDQPDRNQQTLENGETQRFSEFDTNTPSKPR
jgi:lipopolysaccharide/colanic/teichoic acid biosynthesis glycosyltransferase